MKSTSVVSYPSLQQYVIQGQVEPEAVFEFNSLCQIISLRAFLIVLILQSSCLFLYLCIFFFCLGLKKLIIKKQATPLRCNFKNIYLWHLWCQFFKNLTTIFFLAFLPVLSSIKL